MYRFRVKATGGETTKLKVDEVEPLEQRFAVSNITTDQITYLVSGKVLTPEVEQSLRRIVEQKNQISALDQQMQTRKTQIDAIDKDQGRLRENMKALKGSPEEKALLQRYTKELNDQEDQLAAVRNEIKALETKRNDARAQLDRMVMELSMDEKI
jgi:predicted  nucleic acid-binding Zn-ribbon protein